MSPIPFISGNVFVQLFFTLFLIDLRGKKGTRSGFCVGERGRRGSIVHSEGDGSKWNNYSLLCFPLGKNREENR
jgi:hypothetical protein